MNVTPYFSNVCGLLTQSAMNTVPSGTRIPVMSKKCPGKATGSSSDGNSGEEKPVATLSFAIRNLQRSSLHGKPP